VIVVIPGRSKFVVVRRFAALGVAAAVVVGLAACSDLPAQVQGCVTAYSSGSASASISAAGKIGQNPKAEVPTPTVTKRVQVSTPKKGSGLLLGSGDIADIQLSLYAGSNGAELDSTGQGGFTKSGELQVTVGGKDTVSPAIAKSLLCQRVGSRVVTVMTAAQYFGTAAAAKQESIDPSLVLVSVADIDRGYRGRATGILQPLGSGFPSVVTSPNGTPGLTLDLQTPPKTLQWEVVRRGSGAKVKAGQEVLLQVQAVAWTDPAPTTPFDTTWTDQVPRLYKLTALSKNATGQSLDPGSVKALVGQTIGSQVLVVVPPKAGYPSGAAPSGYPTKSTLIFVYDVLGVY
jgi:peptidylprolyl isomerase